MEHAVQMLLEGAFVKLIVRLDPSLNRKFIWKNKKGKPMLYMRLKKALYGTLHAALLFLVAIVRYANRMGLQAQCLRQMCCK